MNNKQQQPKTVNQPVNYQPVIPQHYITAYNNLQQKRTDINEKCPHDAIAAYKEHKQCLQCKKIFPR